MVSELADRPAVPDCNFVVALFAARRNSVGRDLAKKMSSVDSRIRLIMAPKRNIKMRFESGETRFYLHRGGQVYGFVKDKMVQILGEAFVTSWQRQMLHFDLIFTRNKQFSRSAAP